MENIEFKSISDFFNQQSMSLTKKWWWCVCASVCMCVIHQVTSRLNDATELEMAPKSM